MKLTMGTSVICGNLFRIKLDFIWVRLLSQKIGHNFEIDRN